MLSLWIRGKTQAAELAEMESLQENCDWVNNMMKSVAT